MTRRMLIDAAHPEQTRVAIVDENRVEEFDFESSSKKQLRGNIYLAKVTRVEPSLQAAFVDYGSDRHGFLPFSEIHPDYYQLPTSDREKLKKEIADMRNQKLKGKGAKIAKDVDMADDQADGSDEKISANIEQIETPMGSQPLYDEEETSNLQFHDRYKIQEVVKKDQVILVQVEKEERGNKGASLSTYLSLAGRYCVFMPNATKGGGISKKIDDDQDRSRLKKVATDLTAKCGDSGAVIIRTAGAFKTKTEITRDLGYLQKLWDGIRGVTVKSSAPSFILEEGDIIKKTIRDLYESDVEQIIIAGKEAHNDAKEFMKMILPKHTSKLKEYKEVQPIFSKYGIDAQLASMYDSKVSLPSGGYLVINNTEALVSIDINSGKSTSERNIENTALKTNLESAEEISRQIKLRDLSGLIVIDFIDMEEVKNRKAVERVFRDCLIHDRAKIQLGRISSFGLLEMSRQRLNPSFIEANTHSCAHCDGRGRIRPVPATTIVVLRAIESDLSKFNNISELIVSGSKELVFYLLNEKRAKLSELESRFGVKISAYVDESAGGDGFFLENKRAPKKKGVLPKGNTAISISDIDYKHDDITVDSEEEEEEIPVKEVRPQKSFSEPRKEKKYNIKRKGGERPRINSAKERIDHIKQKKQSVNLPSEEDIAVTEKFDEEMASRRQKNQSLLKEIWKKIVD